MGWSPTAKELAAVSRLEGRLRYEYLVKKVADQQQLWSLSHDGEWVLASDDVGHELVPVWPHADFALACCTQSWIGATPKSISLEVWLDRWLPGIRRDGRSVAAFPTSDAGGVVIGPEQFATDLRLELENY